MTDWPDPLYGMDPATSVAARQLGDEVSEFFVAADRDMRRIYDSEPKPWLDYCKVYALDKWDFHRPGGSIFGAAMEISTPDESLSRDLATLALRTEHSLVTRVYVERGEVLDELPFPGLLRAVIVPPQLEADVLMMEWAGFGRIQVNLWLPIAGDDQTCYIVDLGAVNLFRYRHHEPPELWLRRRDYENGWPATAHSSHCVYAELADESKVKRWIP